MLERETGRSRAGERQLKDLGSFLRPCLRDERSPVLPSVEDVLVAENLNLNHSAVLHLRGERTAPEAAAPNAIDPSHPR